MEKTRAVAYIRVSTERDAQLHSYEFQEHYWQSAFEDDPNTDLIGIYADKGISGHSVQKRPKFLVMMQEAREHKFDKIYTKSVSRFARNTTQLLEAVRELRDLGIEVVFENENIHTFQPTSEIFLTIAATIAENDLEVDSARQRWSIQHRCENGWISVGSGLFGLKLTADNELEIVPEEAAVIRYIYESYVDGGIGSKKIADALNAAGVQSRNGYPWDAKHIIGLLRNEKYKGDVIMGKSVRHFGEYHKNPNAEYAPRYYMEGTHEAIVDRDMWEAAQRILEERSRNHCRTRIAHSFTGMIECGCCGKNYLHKVNNSQCKWQTDIWACRTYLRDGKKACGNSRIKDTVLKEKFISAYNEFIERRPQGDSMVALQEVLEDLRQQEQELAELADLPLQKVNLLTQAMRGVESIDAPIGDEEDATKLDFVRGNERDDPGVAFQDRSMIDCIQKSLNELNPREAQVLRLRYGIGTNQDHTLEEVGRTLGLTRERVRQIESAAIRKLRTPDFTERLRDYLQS